MLVTFFAVEKPAVKMRLAISRSVIRAAFYGLGADGVEIKSGTIVGNLNVDFAAFVEGTEKQQSLGAFSCRLALVWSLDPMIERVANDVRKRVLDGLDDGFVEFGLRALHLKAHQFPG